MYIDLNYDKIFEGDLKMSVNQEMVKQILSEIKGATLVAATKYVGMKELIELYENNVKVFGENKVQSLLEKYENFPYQDVTWHMIGTLQTNKVKYIIDKVKLIHAVDTLSLLKEINKQAKKHDLIMPVLIQVNISHEESKHGFERDEVESVIDLAIKEYPNVQIKGFMTMAPNMEPSETEIYFEMMEQLLHDMQAKYPTLRLSELSMGMSNDYMYAYKHGATYIRVGSKLFNK